MKRITAILLALALCVTLLPAFACAAEWEYVDNANSQHTSEMSALTIKNGQCVRAAVTGTPTGNGEYSFSESDYYKFTLTEKSIISLYVVDGNFYMGLLDGQWKRFSTASSFDGKSANRLFMALDAGTYTVEVSYNADTSKNETENYKLYFECKKASVVAPSEENTLGMENFQKATTYVDGQFTDVAPNQWYYENVKTAYELGIVKGTGANSYGSKNTVTLAEALALASRLHSIYHTGKADFKQGDVWYQVYLDYAISNGIIRNCGPVIASGEHGDYAATAATREQFVCMMKNAFPDSEFLAINNIEKGKIPDVSTVSFDADAIYTMYNAGIVTGNDGYGTFTPNNTITRSEVAAIIARMVDSSLRKHFTIADKPIDMQK